jgi:hypothetical protein
MKKLLLVVIAITSFFSSFGMAKKKKRQQNPNQIISVNMNRTPCYGRCPNYNIDLDKDGKLVYTAVRFTEDSGIFKKTISAKKAQELISRFESYRVDTCREMYESRIADLPGIVYTIKYPNRTQKIINANFGPAFLTELAEAMDAIGLKPKGDRTWKKVGMPKYE